MKKIFNTIVEALPILAQATAALILIVVVASILSANTNHC